MKDTQLVEKLYPAQGRPVLVEVWVGGEKGYWEVAGVDLVEYEGEVHTVIRTD